MLKQSLFDQKEISLAYILPLLPIKIADSVQIMPDTNSL